MQMPCSCSYLSGANGIGDLSSKCNVAALAEMGCEAGLRLVRGLGGLAPWTATVSAEMKIPE